MANSIKIGGYSFDALKIGGSDVDAAYLGDALVYSGGTTPPSPTPSVGFITYDENGGVLTSGSCQDLSNNILTSNEVSNNYSVTYDLMYSVEVGDCVTTIEQLALSAAGFFGTPSFTSITIGSGVTTIGDYNFVSDTCQSITIKATIPPTIGNDQFDLTNNCPIYVPSASVSAYQSASGWSQYASRITAIPNS